MTLRLQREATNGSLLVLTNAMQVVLQINHRTKFSSGHHLCEATSETEMGIAATDYRGTPDTVGSLQTSNLCFYGTNMLT